MPDPIWLTIDDQVNRLDTALRCLNDLTDRLPDYASEPGIAQDWLTVALEYLATIRDSLHQAALDIKGEEHLTVI